MAAGEADGVQETGKNNPENAVEDDDQKEQTELEKYWKAVKDSPSDFTGWTYLLQYVEQEGNAENAREAFDAFLERYPYCYGYWKKYADLEKKGDNSSKVEQVFEAGLMAIPLSIDLWIHYINFTINKLESDPDKEALLRRLFERAIAAAGTDFRSDKLWDMFINWEKDNKLPKNVTELYDRVLSIPTQLYSHHFENFSEHVKNHHPKDILRLDEFLTLRKEVVANREATKKENGEDEDEPDSGPPGAPLEDAPPGLDALPPGTDPAATQVLDAEVPLLRDSILEKRRKIYNLTEQEVSRRWAFEEGIRRPYFHVKPLEKVQLKNWKDYLNFEIENGTHERVVVLFERCMIACALYEDFWLKYATYMEDHSIEGVRNVFKRACTIHLRKKPNIHLAWAAFEERQGNNEGALEIMKNFEALVPGLALVALRRIGMERRHGNFETIEELYSKYIEEAEDKEMKSFYAMKYCRYLAKVLGNIEKARGILTDVLKEDPTNSKVLLQLIDLEYQQPTIDEPAVLKAFEQALSSDLSVEQKVTFSQRKLEFLEDFGSNISRTMEAHEEYQKLVKEMQNSKKRKNDEKEETSNKKAKISEESSTTVTNGAGDSTQPATQPTGGSMDASMNYGYSHSWPGYGAYGYQPGWGGYGGYYASQ